MLLSVAVAEEHTEIEPLDEDFLEFISNMSEVDGVVIDSLDMLEIADNEMMIKTNVDNELLNENRESPELNSSIKEKKL